MKKETKDFRLVLPEALHRQTKMAAAAAGKTMTAWIIEAIKEKNHETRKSRTDPLRNFQTLVI